MDRIKLNVEVRGARKNLRVTSGAMMMKFILSLVIPSVVLITGLTTMISSQQSPYPGFSSGENFQSCQDIVRNCKCDRLCTFYGDCCKDFKSDGQSTLLYTQSNELLNFDDFECRLIPGYEARDYDLALNCMEKISYWMISRCPRTASKTLKTQCEEKHTLDELVEVRYIRPVNDGLGNVYKNYYCALCHNVSSDEMMLWPMTEVCLQCPEELPLSQNHFIDMNNGHCFVSAREPTIKTHEFLHIPLRTCYKDMVRSCPVGSNANDSAMCSQVSSPGYFNGVYFKNIFCGWCHGMESFRDWSPEFPSYICRQSGVGVPPLPNIISFRDSLCTLIRCSRPLNLCSGTGRSSLQYLTLTVDDTFRCSHLTERGERCFFKESQVNPMIPLFRMNGTNPLWSKSNKESRFVAIYQLPQNITANSKIQFEKDILKTARHLIQKPENPCYLKNMEVVEVCSAQDWEILGECNGELVEVHGDEILETENIVLNEISFNLSNSMLPAWYSVHTRFQLKTMSISVKKRTLVCFVLPEIQESPMWHRVLSGSCIAITVLFHLATFVTYATFRPLRNTFGISLMCFVMSLAIALCLLEFVAGYITGIEYLCQIVAIGSHYFWLSSFCWVTVLAWDLHVTLSPSKLRVRQASSWKRLLAYCCFGWGLPCIIIAICVTLWVMDIPQFSVTYGSVRGTMCWIHDDWIRLAAVAGPLLGCIVTNICLSIMIWRSLYNYKKDSRVTQKDLHNPKRRMLELVVYVKISMLMGFSWIFGFLADFTKVKALWCFFYLSFLIQACLIFVFFGLSGKVRTMWRSSTTASSRTKSTSVN